MTVDRVEVPEALRQKIREHGEAAYPEECCGILFGRKKEEGIFVIRETVPVKNRVSGKGSHYGIDPLELHAIEEEKESSDQEILGFYHSHPDHPAILSEEDAEEMVPGMLYLILSVPEGRSDRLRAWRKDPFTGKVSELRSCIS